VAYFDNPDCHNALHEAYIALVAVDVDVGCAQEENREQLVDMEECLVEGMAEDG
jgi:hypothetical protein